jgi:hypothetical protein
MPQVHVLRIGSVTAVLGGIFTLAGNIIHPRAEGQLEDPETLLQIVAGSDIWVADHVIIAIGVTLLLGAFYGVTHSISDDSATAWAGLAWGVAIVGVGLGALLMLTEAVAVAGIAETWATSSGTEADLALAAGSALFHFSLALAAAAPLFLFGIAPMLTGRAILSSHEYPSWVGVAGMILGGIGVVANIGQVLTGVTTQSGLVLVPIGIVGVTVWMIYLGVVMWRRSIGSRAADDGVRPALQAERQTS